MRTVALGEAISGGGQATPARGPVPTSPTPAFLRATPGLSTATPVPHPVHASGPGAPLGHGPTPPSLSDTLGFLSLPLRLLQRAGALSSSLLPLVQGGAHHPAHSTDGGTFLHPPHATGTPGGRFPWASLLSLPRGGRPGVRRWAPLAGPALLRCTRGLPAAFLAFPEVGCGGSPGSPRLQHGWHRGRSQPHPRPPRSP